jgi:hypothetical protein
MGAAMSRRGMKNFGVTIALLLTMAVLAGWWVFSYETPTERNYREFVRLGMTLEQLEAFIGPGKRTLGPPILRYGTWDFRPTIQGDQFYSWTMNGGTISVGVKDGIVVDRELWRPEL